MCPLQDLVRQSFLLHVIFFFWKRIRHILWKTSIFFSSPLFVFHISHLYSSTGFSNVLYSKIFVSLWISFVLHVSFSCMNVYLAFPIMCLIVAETFVSQWMMKDVTPHLDPSKFGNSTGSSTRHYILWGLCSLRSRPWRMATGRTCLPLTTVRRSIAWTSPQPCAGSSRWMGVKSCSHGFNGAPRWRPWWRRPIPCRYFIMHSLKASRITGSGPGQVLLHMYSANNRMYIASVSPRTDQKTVGWPWAGA